MELTLNDLVRIMDRTHLFRKVKRQIPYEEGDQENDAEHSFQLALVAWFVVDSQKLPLDLTKVLKYALAHDLPEIYAGDVCCHIHDPNKKQREHDAMKRLALELFGFPDLHTTMERYEEQQDPESQFVWALDKLIPMINILISRKAMWKEEGITLKQLLANKDSKVTTVPELRNAYAELVDVLRRSPELFAP